MIMGLEPLDPFDLIEIDEYYEEEIALRRQYLADMRDTVLQTSAEVFPRCSVPLCLRAKSVMWGSAVVCNALLPSNKCNPLAQCL